MHRLAVRPLTRALRARHQLIQASRLASAANGSSSNRRYATTTPGDGTLGRVRRPKAVAKSTIDPAGVYTPAEFIQNLLEDPQVQQVVKKLSEDDAISYNSLLQRLTGPNGHADLLAINDMEEFLAERGVGLDLPETLFDPPTDKVFHESEEEVDYSFTEFKNAPQKKSFRSLAEPRPHLDARDVVDFPPDKTNPYGGRVVIRNHKSIFDNGQASSNNTLSSSSSSSSSSTTQTFALSMKEVRELYQSILISRTTRQQTGKGKIMRKFFLVCVGNGNGLVGYGQAKDLNARLALQKARMEAVKNMDSVERFEQRTVWTEMETKLGATQILLRPRPVGFGLRCNPYLHQILRAAGVKDISAKVWGSRNKLNVIKAAFRMLHAGHAPVGMGDGVGGPGKKMEKGIGMRGQAELERARGRKLISLRK